MVAALLISLHEGLEAALIVTIVLDYVARTKHGEHIRSVWAGVLAAIVASVLIALGIQAVGAELDERAEEMFEGTTILLPLTIEHVWDTHALLDERSLPGDLPSALFGYNGNPSLLEVISCGTYWGLVLIGLRSLPNRLVACASGALAR